MLFSENSASVPSRSVQSGNQCGLMDLQQVKRSCPKARCPCRASIKDGMMQDAILIKHIVLFCLTY